MICPHWRQCIVRRRAGSESGRATADTSFHTPDFQRNLRTEVVHAAHCPWWPQSEMREEATCARAHSIKSSCSPAMRQKTAANVPRWQSELYLVHRRESFHGVFTEESAKWTSVRSSRHQEEAGRGWASVAYANNVQSVGDGVGRTGRCLKACVRVQDLRCGTNVTFRCLGGTRVKFRFLAYLVNSGRPVWSMVQIREKLPMATAQATCVSAGELG